MGMGIACDAYNTAMEKQNGCESELENIPKNAMLVACAGVEAALKWEQLSTMEDYLGDPSKWKLKDFLDTEALKWTSADNSCMENPAVKDLISKMGELD